MKAAEFDRFGAANVLRIREVEDPTISAGDVLVRVAASAVNPKDTFVRKGRFAFLHGRRFPKRTGYDFSGTVVRVGATATLKFERVYPATVNTPREADFAALILAS